MAIKRLTAVLAVVAILAAPAVSQAAFLTEWAGTADLTDPIDPALAGGQDILGVYLAQDADYFFFRMDLRDAPVYLSTNYAGVYGIYIDLAPGGASDGDSTYIPTGLTGIDYIVDAHFNRLGTNAFDGWDTHTDWNPTTAAFLLGSPVAHQESENAGKSIEFKVLKSDLPGPFTYYAATHDIGSSDPTYDLVVGSYVPEPATLGLLAVGGLLALARRRRRV